MLHHLGEGEGLKCFDGAVCHAVRFALGDNGRVQVFEALGSALCALNGQVVAVHVLSVDEPLFLLLAHSEQLGQLARVVLIFVRQVILQKLIRH